MQRLGGVFLCLAGFGAASRFFVPQPPVVQVAQPAAQPWPAGQLADRMQRWRSAVPVVVTPSESGSSALLYGAGAVVAALSVGVAVGGAAHLLGRRQQLMEADEANSEVQLRMLAEKQALAENKNAMAYNYFGYTNSAMDSLLQRRQMMVEQEETESEQQLQFLAEKQMVEQANAALQLRRQMLVEQEEAASVQQLQFVAEKQLVEQTAAVLAKSRQMLIEQEEAQSVQQLQFVEEKQMVEEALAKTNSVLAFNSKSMVYRSAAMESIAERRQLLVEQEEANSLEQLQYIEESQKAAEMRRTLFSFDAQMQAVQDSVEAALTCGDKYLRELPGGVPSFGYFDPLGILTGSTEEKVQYYRDAELKHGRIGTLAAIGIVASENFHAMLGDELTGVPAVFAFQQNMILQTAMVASAAALISRPQRVPKSVRKQTTEIWHVRGGMLAAFGMIAKEAVTSTCLVCI
jgi:hypothetical protein